MTDAPSPDFEAAQSLLSAAAVRERANRMLEHGLAGRLQHFTVDLARLDACADEVVTTIRQAYPDLSIPFHARWRHFAAGGIGRWGAVMQGAPWEDAGAMARAAFDLAIVSVLLDAGAGAEWRYEEGRTGETYTRSEGLAVASFDMFVSGAFSGRSVPATTGGFVSLGSGAGGAGVGGGGLARPLRARPFCTLARTSSKERATLGPTLMGSFASGSSVSPLRNAARDCSVLPMSARMRPSCSATATSCAMPRASPFARCNCSSASSFSPLS